MTVDTAPTSRLLHQLLLSLEPRSAYSVLVELCQQRFDLAPLGAWIATDEGSFEPDPAFPADPAVAQSGTSPDFCDVVYHYRGRPLGRLRFEANPNLEDAELRRFLDGDFAPAMFRAAWLEDALERVRRSEEQARFLQEMGGLLGRTELQPLLVSILDMITTFLDVPLGALMLSEDGVLRDAVEWGLPTASFTDLRLTDHETAVERALRAGTPQLFSGEDFCPTPGIPRPDRLLLCPMSTQVGVVGLIAVAGDRGRARLTPDCLETVGPAVRLAATAIENARLFGIKLEREKERQQLSLARQIQAGLLPSSPPPTPGLSLAACSIPARAIGGDYYDYLRLPDGTLAVVVADVAGKGVAAALIMTAVRATFRAAALEYASPARILARVNRSLAEESFDGRFVTAVVVRVDTERGLLTVSCAGHEPLMLRRGRDESVERVGRPNLPLGVLPEVAYHDVVAEVEPGDAFLLFTDGVTEAMNGRRQVFGGDRLVSALAGSSDNAAALRDRVLQSLAQHVQRAPRHDDTTLVVGTLQVVEKKVAAPPAPPGEARPDGQTEGDHLRSD